MADTWPEARPPGSGFGTLPYNPGEMHDAPLPDLILYGRPDCSLCDEARETVAALFRQRTHEGRSTPHLIERDIDTNDAWHDAYFAAIPVLEFGDRRLELATSQARFRRLLADVLD